MHDPRIGRFFAVDPLTKKYPHYTPYSFSGNKVIHAVELEGLEEAEINDNGFITGTDWSRPTQDGNKPTLHNGTAKEVERIKHEAVARTNAIGESTGKGWPFDGNTEGEKSPNGGGGTDEGKHPISSKKSTLDVLLNTTLVLWDIFTSEEEETKAPVPETTTKKEPEPIYRDSVYVKVNGEGAFQDSEDYLNKVKPDSTNTRKATQEEAAKIKAVTGQ